MKLQKLGGYAAIASLCAYIVGVLYIIFIQPNGFSDDPAKAMAAISASPGEFYMITTNLCEYHISWWIWYSNI